MLKSLISTYLNHKHNGIKIFVLNSNMPHHPPCNILPRHLHNLPDFLLTALSFPSTTTTTNRHFLRLTTTTTMLSTTTITQFPTPQSLQDWLIPRLPSSYLSTWGTTPGSKNLLNLWLELSSGETSLADSIPPLRTVELVSVRTGPPNSDKKLVLIETHQELSDGSLRKRGRPLSEKIKPGEAVESAVKRAVKEELGSVIYERLGSREVDYDEIVEVVMGSYVRTVEERVSVSYPGLPACYVVHQVDAYVEGLPDGEFVTEEEGDEYGVECDSGRVGSEAIKVKKHFWKWVPADSL